MNEIFEQIVSHLIATWRRRWYAVGIAWLICGAGWSFVAGMPDKYESSARIYADMDTMLGPLMRGLAVEMNLFQQIDFMQRTLLSQPNLEKVVLMTDLDLTVRDERGKEALLKSLKQRIKVGQQGRNLFKVTFEDRDPAMTKRVVQAVLQIFVEGNIGASRKDMDTTRRFIEGQIKEYERQLEEAEARLSNFKRKNMGFMPGSGENYYGFMQRVRAQVAKTQAQIAEGTSVRDELREQLASVPQLLELPGTASLEPLAAADSQGPESGLQIRIMELERIVDSLLTRYTDRHPDVVSAKRRIAALQTELEAEQEMAAMALQNEQNNGIPEPPAKNLVPNPVYEQIKLQLVQQEAAVAALTRRLKKEQEEVEKWEKMALLVPQVEAELVRLNRDYDIIKNGYGQLRRRQESARLARDLETKAQKVQFRIIEPPKVPIKPSGPNRILFASMVLLAGIASGTAFAFLLAQLTTTFPSIQRLRAVFALPVVGSVSVIKLARERRRAWREMFGFGLVSMSLVVAFCGLLVVEKMGHGASLIATVKEYTNGLI